jgi:hypothetical protein
MEQGKCVRFSWMTSYKECSKENNITLTQPGLLQSIVKNVRLNDYSKGKDTLTDSILYTDQDGVAR